MTYTPRLLLVDLKENAAHLPLRSDLYEYNPDPDSINDELWPASQTEIIREPKFEKNEFLDDLEKGEEEMAVEGMRK